MYGSFRLLIALQETDCFEFFEIAGDLANSRYSGNTNEDYGYSESSEARPLQCQGPRKKTGSTESPLCRHSLCRPEDRI